MHGEQDLHLKIYILKLETKKLSKNLKLIIHVFGVKIQNFFIPHLLIQNI